MGDSLLSNMGDSLLRVATWRKSRDNLASVSSSCGHSIQIFLGNPVCPCTPDEVTVFQSSGIKYSWALTSNFWSFAWDDWDAAFLFPTTLRAAENYLATR